MFIYHFNRMIRSRILWTVFAVIIAFAFLSVDSCNNNAYDNGTSSTTSIGGKEVSSEEYNNARRMAQIRNMLSRRGEIPEEVTDTQVLSRIAVLRLANEMYITATDDEIRAVITADRSFVNEMGVFDRNRYEYMLAQIGLTPQTYEYFLREEITINKIVYNASACNLPSQIEIEEQAKAYTDTITFRYASITNSFGETEVVPTEEAIQAYYNENTDNYRVPAQVKVRYIKVPVTNYIAEASVEADRIEDWYESNADKYTRQGTNGVEQLTLEEAYTTVSNELALVDAADKTLVHVYEYMTNLSDMSLEDFTLSAKARNYAVIDSGYITADTRFIPDVENTAMEDFIAGAIELDTDPTAEALYGLARGTDNIYLMRVVTNEAAHVQSYEAVKESILPILVNKERDRLFEEYYNQLHAEIKAGLATNDIAAVCAANGLNLSTSVVHSAMYFNPTSGTYEFAPPAEELIPVQSVIREIVSVKPGNITKPAKTYDGAVIAYVEERTPAADYEKESIKQGITQSYTVGKIMEYEDQWMEWYLKKLGYTSRYAAPAATDNDDDE